MIKFHDVTSLAAPAAMVALECLVHFGADPFATVGLMYQHGVGPLMFGSGFGVAVRETKQSTDYGLLISPEVSLPLRLRAHPRFAPSVVLFVRFDLVASTAFDSQAIMGASVAVW